MKSMRQLMEAVEDREKGKNGYISVSLHPEDATKLENHLKNIDMKDYINPSSLHCTLFYCDDGMDTVEIDENIEYVAKNTEKYEILGDPPWKAVVLRLESTDLENRHKEIKDITGAKHSYPDFKLHLSLKYDATDDDLELIKQNPIEMSEFRLINESQEDIKPKDDL